MIETVLLYLAVIIIVTAVILIGIGADEIRRQNEDGSDADFKRSENLLIAAAIVDGIAGFIVLWIAMRSSRDPSLLREIYFQKGSVRGIIFLVFIALVVGGGLAWFAAEEMKKSKNFGKAERTAFARAHSGALISWTASAFILIAFAFTYAHPKREELEEKVAAGTE